MTENRCHFCKVRVEHSKTDTDQLLACGGCSTILNDGVKVHDAFFVHADKIAALKANPPCPQCGEIH